ncbi:MAG: HEAT repeat domain-containing protein [Myxococcota bacterium]
MRGSWLGAILVVAGCGNPNKADYWIGKLDDPATELEAVQNLQKIGDPAAVEPLGKLFAKKRHPDILRAIVSFKDKPGFKNELAMPTLLSALDFTEDEYNNATVAAEAIADLGAVDAIDTLVAVLDKPLPVRSRANLAKLAAIQSLARLGDPRAVDGLIKTMERPIGEQDFMLAKKAAEALGELGDARAAKPLVRGLFYASTAHAPMFVEARVALVRLGQSAIPPLIAAHQGQDEEINALAKKLEFKPGIVAHKTALVLGDLRAAEATAALRATLKAKGVGPEEDASMSHRGTIYALGMIGTVESLPDLLWALEKHPDWKMRVAAAEALNLHGGKDALPKLLQMAKSGFIMVDGEKYNELRWASAMAYSRAAGFEGYAGLEPIAKAATEEDGKSIFDECLQRLEVSRECKEDAACYARALNDGVLVKQESAAFHLARLADGKSQRPAVLKKLGTKEPVVRLAVLYALDRLGDKACQDCLATLRAQIEKERGKTAKALGADLVSEMRCTLARIARI